MEIAESNAYTHRETRALDSFALSPSSSLLEPLVYYKLSNEFHIIQKYLRVELKKYKKKIIPNSSPLPHLN